MRRNILVAAFLAILALGVVLSLQRTSNDDEPSGEIRHFSTKAIEETLRLKNGETIAEYYHQHIHGIDRHKPARNRLPKESKATYQEGVLLTYSVVPNDTLMKLANDYHVTPYQIRKRNHFSEKDFLRVGQKLHIVPGEKPSYRVRPGDNLTMIGKRFGVDHNTIIQLNHLESGRPIWVGQKLLMPIAQQKIDSILAAIAKKKQEMIARKKHYERQLLARLARQKLLREQQAKALAEKKAQKAKQARLAKAKHTFRYTGSKTFKHKIRVAATAYTSHRSQTDSTPFIAAWNNRIRPGMKIIAVSPDLIRKYGITNGVRVKISGLPGTYVVRDKMNARLHDHIDIYMGVNRRRALRWGRRRVVMYW